jgi:putative DNA primase/helicase
MTNLTPETSKFNGSGAHPEPVNDAAAAERLALRLRLVELGYVPIPTHGKIPVLKGWNAADFFKRQIASDAKRTTAQKLARWDAPTTGGRMDNGLGAVDLDVNDRAGVAAILTAIEDIAPDVAARAPTRYGGGEKLALFVRITGKEPFVRVGSRKYHRPGEPPDKYHHVEIFGGKANSNGNCSRQFALFGPRSYAADGVTVESEYVWAEGVPALHEIALADLPTLDKKQALAILDAFETWADAAGWIELDEVADEREGNGVDIFDIDEETTRFDVFQGAAGVSYAALDSGERVSPSFMGENSERPDRCSVFWSTRFGGCICIKDWKTSARHYPKQFAPPDISGLGDALKQWAKNIGVEFPAGVFENWRAPTAAAMEQVDGVVTQDAVARVFARRFEGYLRFCHHTGAWFVWTGTHWKRDHTALAFDFCRALGREFTSASNKTEMKEVRKVSFAGGVEKFAKTDRAIAVTSELWDRDPFLLGTPGGTVELRTGLLRQADQADGITKITAVAPSESADCPLWLTFLDETFGKDKSMIRFIQQWCGYCLTGDTSEHALVFGFGNGGNGKGTWLNTVVGIMGDYAVVSPMETFTASKWDRHPTELAMLRGARLVTASETEEGRAWAESRIKQITGGDPITARFMHKDFFTYTPAFKLTPIGNHKPKLHTVDDAIRRRFNLVPFDRKPKVPDLQLMDKLKAERPGILRWMIEGCLDWQRHGLVRPEPVRQATESYFAEQDLMGLWLDEMCDVDLGNRRKFETSAQLFASWTYFAQKAGEAPGTQTTFGTELTRRGFEQGKVEDGKVRVFRGLSLKNSPGLKLE